MNLTVIKQTMQEALRQPAILFLLIIELAFLGLFIAGLHLKYEQGALISIKFLGSEFDETEAHFFLREAVPNIVFLLSNVMMFLLIVGTTPIFPDMLRDPILGISLTKPVTRNAFLLSKFAGANFAVLFNLVAFTFLIVLVLLFKTGGLLIASPMSGALWFFCQFFAVSAFAMLVAMLVENGMGVAVISLAVYFVLHPLFIAIEHGKSMTGIILSSLFPPIGDLGKLMRDTLFHNNPALDIPFRYPLYLLAYLCIAMILFNRKDLH